MAAIVYIGERDRDGRTTVLADGKDLPLRLDVRKHSPTGFEWGYHGSGPAQLALAILCDHLGSDSLALKLYQGFKTVRIAVIEDDLWRLTREQVAAALAPQLEELRLARARAVHYTKAPDADAACGERDPAASSNAVVAVDCMDCLEAIATREEAL